MHISKNLLTIGKQKFETGTVNITYKNKTKECPMFQEAFGDIGFIFNGEKYYFSDYVQRITYGEEL